MRVGIVSTNEVQKSLAIELLEPLVGPMKSYDLSHAESGELETTNVHFLIVDMSDPALLDCAEVMEMVAENDICIMHEKDLYAMTTEERIAWRNRTVELFKQTRPDLAEDLDAKKDEADNKNIHDVWLIGSSAGGPQALKEMLTDLPGLPITIFIAQHISESAFLQVLQRVKQVATAWTVETATDGAPVLPKTIYLVPRDFTVEIRRGVINLTPNQVQDLSFNPCIDAVIRSLHASHSKLGVVILSGMGMDGSAGIRGIKGKAKMIMAQDQASSGAKGMPDSARATGAVHLSATPVELGRHLAQLYQ